MSGYEGIYDQTPAATRDGWFRAGELAKQDAEGFFYLAGRKKDMIIRGGENIYPIEIETVLAGFPDVEETAVIGVPHPHLKSGEIVRAYLVLRAGGTIPSENALESYCRSSLASYKVPAQWEFVDELPKNASGKILKRQLRASITP